MKKEFLAFLALLLGSVTTSYALEGNTDFQFNKDDKTTERTNLSLDNFSANFTTITKDNKLELVSFKPKINADLFTGKAYLTMRFDKKLNADNLLHVSPGFGKSGIYIEPVFTTIDELGNMKEVDSYAGFNGKIGNQDLEIAGIYLNPVEGDNLSAGYAAINNDKIGAGVVKEYDDTVGVQLALNNGKFTELMIADYNSETKKWHGRVYVAENGCGALTTKGPSKFGASKIGWDPNGHPYFTSTANKSSDGFAAQLKAHGTSNTIDGLLAEFGYNFGKLRALIGQKFDVNNETSTAYATLTYDFKNGLVEVKVGDEGVLGAYVNMKY